MLQRWPRRRGAAVGGQEENRTTSRCAARPLESATTADGPARPVCIGWPQQVAHESEINAVAASRKGNLFATASGDRTIKVFDGQGTTRMQVGPAQALGLTGAQRSLPPSSYDAGSAKAIMRGASQGMMSVQFSKNDELILGASNDNVVRIWYVETGRTRVRQDRTGRGGPAAAHLQRAAPCRGPRAAGPVHVHGPHRQGLRGQVHRRLDPRRTCRAQAVGHTRGHPLGAQADTLASPRSPPGCFPQISGSQDRWIKVWDLEKNYCKGGASAEVEGRPLLTMDGSASRWALGGRPP